MSKRVKKLISGIIVTTLLILAEVLLDYKIELQRTESIAEPQKIFPIEIIPPKPTKATILAFGDINLGRKVGQIILSGNIDFPFEKIDLQAESADILFGNLESPLSHQNGETVSPKSNIVFTGPPQGALALKNAGFTVLSTANNHSLDYGKRGLVQTMKNLSLANILYCGTSQYEDSLYYPVIIEKNTIKFAIFAVTSFVNFDPKGWRSLVASVDTIKLLEKIKNIRNVVDVIVLSYHGGTEYKLKPDQSVNEIALWSIRNGIDIFLGHHPHVTYGIEKMNSKFIVYSLGNFVFYQPQNYWTQRSYGIKFIVEKSDTGLSIDIGKIIPLNVGFQTMLLRDSAEAEKLLNRTQQLSNFDLSTYWN